ncbi:hypothetical protein F511_22851 [Dorcoceras hygrometricum]|uniref:Uncharacterized protein n=1 Tax=Dorcoceras hygrometricum TaxID=472368 RepID=A0A2Z7BRD2_9LAMI|nr:hypothetical protein F511_22851 [Dorcoceras hygrometricum]
MMNSRRICPADGSQYKDSAVGLVFMESTAGLALETSKVESAVRNQQEATVISRNLSADEKRSERVKRRRARESADGLALMTSLVTSSQSADEANSRPSSPYTPPPAVAAAASSRRKIVSGQFDEENPFVPISSVLLVQADEGVSFLVVDRISDFYRNLPRRADVIVTTNRKTEIFSFSNLRPPHATAPTCMRERARSRAIGLRTRCARPPTRGRYSTCDCRTSPAKVCVRLARSCALLDAEESRAGRASCRCSMRDGGRSLPLHVAPRRATMAGRRGAAGRHWKLAGRATAARDLRTVLRRLGAASRTLSPFVMLVAAAGRPSLRSPPRRVSGDVVTAGLNSSRVWFGPVPGSP